MAAVKNRGDQPAWVTKVSAADGEVVLELGGEVDIASVGFIEDEIAEALAENPATVVFELRELRFMDSSGIALLLATAHRVEHVELRYPTATVRRVIELAGLGGTLHISA